jgi:hypothetical protein
MDSTVLVALLSLVGTLFGSLAGIVVSSKLTNYRLEQLEKKVDKHNGFAEKIPVLEEKLSVANNRIVDLERQVEHLMAPGA